MTISSGAFINQVAEAVPNPLVVLDAELRLTAANRAFCRLFSVTDDTLAFERFVRFNRDTPVFAALETAFKSGTLPEKQPYSLRTGEEDHTIVTVSGRVIVDEDTLTLWLNLEPSSPTPADEQRRLEMQIYDAVEQAIIATNLRGIITYWNHFAEKLYGWTRDEVIGKPLRTFLVSEGDNTRADEILALLHQGKSWSGEFRVKRRDGSFFPALVTDSPIRDENGQLLGIVGISVDITEQIRARRQLEDSEERYRRLVELSPNPILIHDDTSILYINAPGARLLFGFEQADTLIGESRFGYLKPELRDRAGEYSAALYNEHGEIRHYETTLDLVTGRTIDIEVFSNPIMYDGKPAKQVIMHDITAYKRAIRTLQQSEERFAKAFHGNPAGITISTLVEKIFVDVNPAFLKMVGFERDEVIGHTPAIFHDDGSPVSEAMVHTLLLDQKQLHEVEITLRSKSGVLRNILASFEVFELDGIEYVLGMFYDITERKRIEQALRESELRLSTIIGSAMDAIITINHQRRIVLFNAAAEQMFRCNARRALGKPISHFIRQRLWKAEQSALELLDSGVSERMLGALNGVRSDGEEFPVEASVSQMSIGDERLYTVILRDVTERELTEAQLRRHAARSEGLADLSRSLSEARMNQQLVAETVVNYATQLIGDGAALWLLSEDRQWLQLTAFSNQNTLMEVRRIPASEGLNGQIVETGTPINVRTGEASPIVPAHTHALLEQASITDVLIVPMSVDGETIGTLNIVRYSGVPYTPDDQVFLQNIADRAALNMRNVRLYTEVQQRQEQMRELARQVVSAQENERRRISRELHDEAGQGLTALKITLQMIEADHPNPEDPLHENLTRAVSIIDHTMQQIRLLTRDLRPPIMDTLDLNATLEVYCQEFTARTAIPVDYEGADLPAIDDTTKIHLYRYLQEALTNVARHAEATHVRVVLRFEASNLELSVYDNGKGFETTAAAFHNRQAGIGLLGMRERLALLGGVLAIKSVTGQGTCLTATVPWQEPP